MYKIMKKMIVQTLLQLQEFSNQLTEQIHKDSVITMSGELGVGKTTLASYILRELVDDEDSFTSPTFNIVHEYYSKKKQAKVFHLDLYRINDVNELVEIGFNDILNSGIVIIEWPEIAFPIIRNMAKDRLIEMQLSFEDEITRKISCKISSHRLE